MRNVILFIIFFLYVFSIKAYVYEDDNETLDDNLFNYIDDNYYDGEGLQGIPVELRDGLSPSEQDSAIV